MPILIPKYYTKPGPARVVIDLLIKPISMTMIIINGLVIAKSLNILLQKSSTLRISIVNATPLTSPRYPQTNAPKMETTEQIIDQ